MISILFGKDEPKTIEEKKSLLKETHLALYDVIEECEIKNSSDASIKNPIVSDLPSILQKTQVSMVLLNGKKAGDLFLRYQLPTLKAPIEYAIMPSTSPANAAVSMADLLHTWGTKLQKM